MAAGGLLLKLWEKDNSSGLGDSSRTSFNEHIHISCVMSNDLPLSRTEHGNECQIMEQDRKVGSRGGQTVNTVKEKCIYTYFLNIFLALHCLIVSHIVK